VEKIFISYDVNHRNDSDNFLTF